MKTVTKYIYNQLAAKHLTLDEAKTMLKELQDLTPKHGNEIAIIGLACRFPKAANPDELWDILINKINCIDNLPPERCEDCRDLSDKSLMALMLGGNPREHESGVSAPGGAGGARGGRESDNIYIKGGYLPEIDKFDATFFKVSPKEAMYTDPLQRFFLEVAYEAMEDAGYGGPKLYGAKVGVFVGRDHTYSTMYREVTGPDETQLTGSYSGILASRIAYLFNFRGPSLVIDTACSSGLVALHEACRALHNKECDTAIAGGIHLRLFMDIKGNSVMKAVESSDDQVRAFDKDASGTVLGEGAAALIVKPLEKAIADHDHIYAVIKGSAINNDGASGGITAPSAEAQKDVIIRAWKEAQVDPETITYIEAHGTGTSLGDPMEIKGVTSAFGEFTAKKQFCGIGSIKTNLGHLVAASGLASVIKVVLAFQKNEIPASINFNSPNPYINFLNSPVFVNDRLRKWNAPGGSPRRAGVSAFGFSGTNCHMILEESPAAPPVGAIHESPLQKPSQQNPGPHILALSARNQTVLQELLKRYQSFLEQNPATDLGNICYTANTGRGHYNFRIAFIATSLDDLKQKIAVLMVTDEPKTPEPGTYVGVTENVPDSEKRQLNSSAAQNLKEFLAAGAGTDRSRELAAELCQVYVKGADIAWAELYQNGAFTKVSLPVYPLERIKCWAPPNTAGSGGLPAISKPIHPLLHRLLAEAPGVTIYGTDFTVEDHWVLKEHRLFDYYIAPGASFLEMARAVSAAHFDDSPIELRDLMFINPLVVDPGAKKEVRTTVKIESDYLDFTVASKTADSTGPDSWAIHARGEIYRASSKESGRYDLVELKASAGVDSNPRLGGNPNFTLGPRWRNIIFEAGQNDQALLQLKLPDEFKDDLRGYGLHPALMDQATAAFTQKLEGTYLPLMYKRMTIYRRMPASFYCYMRRKDQQAGNPETILFDVTFIDESGQVFIDIEDYSLKRVKNGKLS